MGHDQRPTAQVVDRSLRRIRFEPRPSLEAELLWRLRRGEEPVGDSAGAPHAGAPHPGLLALAVVAVGVLIFLFWVRLLSVAPGS